MTYHGRKAPNVSEYIANLNALPTAQDLQNSSQDNFNLEDELAMYADTRFFDFDLGQDADLQPTDFGLDATPGQGITADSVDMKPLDFSLQGDFSFPDFTTFSTDFSVSDALPTPIQPNQPLYGASSTAGSPTSTIAPPPFSGAKRKSDQISSSASPPAPDTQSFEEASRLAAEEDKRRRNTAASARFRVKKKQREQALERSAKEMSDKVAALEGRINQLETENKWLKNLITEKNESNEDISVLWKKYNEGNTEKKASERKDGVGTKV